jgi:hypothetical protein
MHSTLAVLTCLFCALRVFPQEEKTAKLSKARAAKQLRSGAKSA